MYTKLLGIEIYVELGAWGKPLFYQPQFLKHNKNTYEVRVLNSIIILNRTQRERNDTHSNHNETG
jgi:hypothetical protein